MKRTKPQVWRLARIARGASGVCLCLLSVACKRVPSPAESTDEDKKTGTDAASTTSGSDRDPQTTDEGPDSDRDPQSTDEWPDSDSPAEADTEGPVFCAVDVYRTCCSEDAVVDSALCNAFYAENECNTFSLCCDLYWIPLRERPDVWLPEECRSTGCFEKTPPACGDGEINQASEECDDGNTNPGDGCSGICQVENDYFCPWPGEPCLFRLHCGDGVLQKDEACEDGNLTAGDGCNSDCEREPGYYCLVPGEPCVPEEVCKDACPVCGNGIVEQGENCDDGVNAGDYGQCAPGCRFLAYCGDGILDAEHGERCDDGVLDNRYDRCAPDCGLAPHCGDGIVQSQHEQCDDGPDNGDYGKCDRYCRETVRCGDHFIQPEHEACDDGNTIPDDYCDNDCHCTAL